MAQGRWQRWMGMIPLLAIGSGAVHAQNQATIIALPDTQNYVINATNAALFTQQTQWIADEILVNGNPRNIRFVTHLGDVVANAPIPDEWARAEASMMVLETGPDWVVPYSILPGNHDYAAVDVKTSGSDDYVASFGPDRFSGLSWYGGAEPSGINSFQRFSAIGHDVGGIAFAHELGHNMGCGHNNGPGVPPAAFCFSYGHRTPDDAWRTIMYSSSGL